MNLLPERNRTLYKKISVILVLTLVITLLNPLFLQVPQAHATTSLLQAMVRLNRLQASTATLALVCAKTSAQNGTEGQVQVTFPTGFTLGAFGTFTIDTGTTTGWPTGSTAWLGVGTATAKSGQVVTFPSSDLATSTLYCFNIIGASAITNPSAANDLVGSIETQTAGGAGIDRGDYAVSIVSAANNDQILVTASV